MKKTTLLVLIISVALLTGLAASPVFGGGEGGLERAMHAQENHTDALLAKAGVVGTALGLDENGNDVIQVFTTRPGVGGIPNSLDGVTVQVKVTGAFEAQEDEETQHTIPVPIGVSSSNVNSIDFPFCFTGTLGARLTGTGGALYALSNNHVYANINGSSGAVPGSSVIQPGLADSSCNTTGTTSIGTLHAYVPMDFDGGDNLVDAAIVSTSSTLVGTATPADGYGEPSTLALTCDDDACGNLLNTPVQKRGRTTHLTTGFITGVNATMTVNYGKGKKARFVDQLIVDGSFSAGGDSGSLVVTNDDNAQPVGLLFAGSGSSTIMNRIDFVFSELATNFVGTVATGLGVDGKPFVADNTGPTVTTVDPDDGATGVGVTASVTVTFSEQVDPATVHDVSFTVDDGVSDVSGDITVAADRFSATFVPDPALANGTMYTVTVTSSVTDIAGNNLDQNEVMGGDQEFTSTFETVADGGGGGGVTVVSIDPDSMDAGTTIAFVITGSGFVEGADVTFENGSGPSPEASIVVVTDSERIDLEITAKSGGPPGSREWNVRVTNPGGASGVCICTLTVIK